MLRRPRNLGWEPRHFTGDVGWARVRGLLGPSLPATFRRSEGSRKDVNPGWDQEDEMAI